MPSIIVTGDVMLGRGVAQAIQWYGAAYPWGNVLPVLKQADLAIVNLECVIAAQGQPWSRWPKEFCFRAPPKAIETLKLAGIDYVSLANNHVLDYEEGALVEMLQRLREAPIAFAGAGENLAEAARPAMLSAGELRIGVVAFTDNEPEWAAQPDTPGTNWIPITLQQDESLLPVQRAIEQARTQGAQLVIFSIHWGPNMVERPPELFRDFAREVIRGGADVFWGHSAHIFQGIEICDGRPILYDAGDFVDDYAVDPRLRNDYGLLYRLQVEGSRVRDIELLPTRIENCQVNLAREADRAAISARIQRLYAEMGTHLQEKDGTLLVECVGPTSS
jgi:poly-gamma-glutamate capsule biosynthesis protein CapA/YwtB (metallophosphatase superfamily)